MFKERTLLKIIKFGIFAVLFTPLVVSEKTIYPLVFGRTLLMQAIICAVFGFWLALVYLYPKYMPKLSLVVSAVLIYFAVVIIASIFGVDFLRSFWGNEERMSGIFTQLHYLALFMIATSIFKTWKEWKNVLLVSVSASALVSLVALLHGAGVFTIANTIADSRISGTIGNPIFFAAYLLFNIFFAGLISVKAKNNFDRYFSIIAGALNLLAFSLANSRGVMVGLILGFLIVIIGYIFFSDSKRIKIAGIGVIVLVLLLTAVLWLNRDSGWVKSVPGVGRFFGDWETASTRFLTWGSAFEAWKENPVLGWGEENFILAFNKYYNPKLLAYSVAETWFDRAHNTILDRLVMGGILGCLAYLAIFFTAIYYLYKKYKDNEIDKRALIIVCGLLAAYFTQNQFAFDEPVTMLMFFLVLAFVNSIAGRNGDESREVFKKPPVIVYAVLIFAVCGILFNYQVYQSSAKSYGAGSGGNMLARERADTIKLALAEWTPYKEDLGDDFIKGIVGDLSEDLLEGADKMYCFTEAEKIGLENISRHPKNTRYYYILGRLYTEMGRSGYPEYFPKSEEMLLKAKELSPKRQQVFYGLGRLYLFTDNYIKAIETDREMVALDPFASEPHWILGVALLVSGNIDDGYAEIAQAGRLGYGAKSASDLELYLGAFQKSGEYDMILDLYEDYALLDSESMIIPTANFCANVAAIYAQKGEKEKAIEAARRAASLDPSFAPEAELFIKMLQRYNSY